jgi:ferritin-like metal-binding protein YciE
MAEMDSLRELYVEELKDLWSAENQILKGLPRMIKAATHPQLKRAFTKHEAQTKQQVKRLERICKELGESPRGKKCVGMEGLIEEAKDLLSEKPEPNVLDAGLISAAQHVEHYEMAGYGTVRTYAQQLGLDDQAELLQQTLDEEGNANDLLTQIAETSVNLEAEQGSEEEEASTSRRGDRQVSRSVATEGTRSKSGGTRGGRGNSRSTSRSQSRAR